MGGLGASVGCMLSLLLLLLLKYHLEEQNVKRLLLQKWKNVPNWPEMWFKTRTWLEEQVSLNITWTGNANILNLSESQCGQICLDMCNFVNIPEYAWNITCLNKPGVQITLNLPKYYMQRLEYAWVWLKQNVRKYARILIMPEQE